MMPLSRVLYSIFCGFKNTEDGVTDGDVCLTQVKISNHPVIRA